MTFPIAGVSVDLGRSNQHDIWLKSVSKRAAGLYKCQVSVEDTFKSISAEKRMEVVERSRQVPAESLLANDNNNNRQQQQRHTVQQKSLGPFTAQSSIAVQQQQRSGATTTTQLHWPIQLVCAIISLVLHRLNRSALGESCSRYM